MFSVENIYIYRGNKDNVERTKEKEVRTTFLSLCVGLCVCVCVYEEDSLFGGCCRVGLFRAAYRTLRCSSRGDLSLEFREMQANPRLTLSLSLHQDVSYTVSVCAGGVELFGENRVM